MLDPKCVQNKEIVFENSGFLCGTRLHCL